MNYDVGVFTRRRIISPAESYFAVPTATGPTGPTWDSANKSTRITLSNFDYTATGAASASNDNVRAIVTSGGVAKYYCEFNIVGATTNVGVGIVSNSFTLGSFFIGGDGTAFSFGYYSDGNVYSIAGTAAALSTYTAGDVIGMAVGFSGSGVGLVWYRKNGGLWNNSGTANPTTDTGPIPGTIWPLGSSWYPAMDAQGAGDSVTLNCSGTYVYSAPSLYGNWT